MARIARVEGSEVGQTVPDQDDPLVRISGSKNSMSMSDTEKSKFLSLSQNETSMKKRVSLAMVSFAYNIQSGQMAIDIRGLSYLISASLSEFHVLFSLLWACFSVQNETCFTIGSFPALLSGAFPVPSCPSP
jgi:hypothetical protein